MTAFQVLQARIDAAYDDGGGTVYLPEGTITVPAGSEVVVKTNVKVVGSGHSVTTLRMASAQTSGLAVVQLQGALAGLEALTVDGNESQQTVAGSGIRVPNVVSGLLLRDVHIVDTWGHGIYHNAASGIQFGHWFQDLVLDNIGQSGILWAGNGTGHQDLPVGSMTGVHILSYAQRTQAYMAGVNLAWPWLIDQLSVHGRSSTPAASNIVLADDADHSVISNYHSKLNAGGTAMYTGTGSYHVGHGFEIS